MFITIEALPTLSARIVRLAQVLSAVHRLIDGKPGKILVEPKQTKAPGKETMKELIDYDLVLDDEHGKEPVMFKLQPKDDTNAEVNWCRENAANYRAAHQQLSAWAVRYETDNGQLHALQKAGVITRLWKTPIGMKRDGLEKPSPLPKQKRVIRDRD